MLQSPSHAYKLRSNPAVGEILIYHTSSLVVLLVNCMKPFLCPSITSVVPLVFISDHTYLRECSLSSQIIVILWPYWGCDLSTILSHLGIVYIQNISRSLQGYGLTQNIELWSKPFKFELIKNGVSSNWAYEIRVGFVRINKTQWYLGFNRQA